MDNNHLEFILDSIPGFVSWIDRDLNYLGVNKQLIEFFKLKEDDFIGKKLGSVSPGNNEQIIEHAKNLFDSNIETTQCEICYTKDSKTFWNLLTIKKYNDDRNALLVSIDITSLKETELKLKDEEASAIHNGRLVAVGEMVGTITHEINNPLAVITINNGVLEKLVSKKEIDIEKIKSLVKINDSSLDKVQKIIKSVKNLVRDGESDDFEEVLFSEVLDDVVLFISKKCSSSNFDFSIINKTEGITLNCNPVQISQTLIILLNNAIDAIEELKSPWIRLEIEVVSNELSISVIDSGQGIPEEISSKMFNSFYTTKKQGKGTGIGLGLAQKIIKSHRGEIKIDKDYSNTKFSFTIPL